MSGRSLIGWVGGVLVAVWAAWGAKADEAVPGAASMPAAPVRTVPAPQSEQVEQIVVTAMRLRTPLRKVGSSVSVLTSQQLARRGYRTAGEALREIPGADVMRQGGLGQLTSVFLRGAPSEHTKVLIDGIEMNDPITPARTAMLDHLDVEDVERIEIIRGPQSVLYGSDALGGVINIITKRGAGDVSGYVKWLAGSQQTFQETVGVGGAAGILDFRFTVSRLDSGGISAAAWGDGNHEKDPYGRTAASGQVGVDLGEWAELVTAFKWIGSRAHIDDGGGVGGDDPNHLSESDQFFIRPELRVSLLDDRWQQRLGLSFANQYRETMDRPNPGEVGGFSHNRFRSRLFELHWQHDLKLHETNTLSFGGEWQREEAWSTSLWRTAWGTSGSSFPRDHRDTHSAFVQDTVELWDRLFVTAGARIDCDQAFGSECTWRVAPAYWIKETDTKLKGSLGTGFKAPSLYQLSAPGTPWGRIGNPDLQPERSRGWDVGFEQYLLDRTVAFGATYFNNRFRNLIDFDFVTGYYNVGKAETQGVELTAAWQPTQRLKIDGWYTYQEATDKTNRDDLIRRPKSKFGLRVNYRPTERLNLNAGLTFVGDRPDNVPGTWPPVVRRNARYAVVNVSASYDLTETVQLFGSVENLLNEQYEDSLGYGTPGCSVFAGIKVSTD